MDRETTACLRELASQPKFFASMETLTHPHLFTLTLEAVASSHLFAITASREHLYDPNLVLVQPLGPNSGYSGGLSIITRPVTAAEAQRFPRSGMHSSVPYAFHPSPCSSASLGPVEDNVSGLSGNP